jgi:excisionase family DNA binding protein
MSRMMTTREVSEYLGISIRTISRYMRQQPAPLPHCYVGRGVRFRREAIDAWVERQQGSAARLPEIVQNALASARKTC